VILASILESSIKLTSDLVKLLELILSMKVFDVSTLLLETRLNLTTLDTNLKFLHVKIESELKNDNELFLDVIQILETDVVPIFNQCFKLSKYALKDDFLDTKSTVKDSKLKKLLKVTKNLSESDSLESLIGNFAAFSTRCLKYSTSFNSSSYYDLKDSYPDTIIMFGMQPEDNFEYEVDYYSLSSKLSVVNDLLGEFESCLDDLQDQAPNKFKSEDLEDDIFGFEYDSDFAIEFEHVQYPRQQIDLKYRLNSRKIMTMC
jgi:hypothetical protein